MYKASHIPGTQAQLTAGKPCGGHANPGSIHKVASPGEPNYCNQLQSVTLADGSPSSHLARALHELRLLGRPANYPLTVEQVAALLGKTRRTIYRWKRDGKMPARVRRMRRNNWLLGDIKEMASGKNTVRAGRDT